jgi:hypothetical protein
MTNLISPLVCAPLVTVGFSLSHQAGHGGLSLPHADLDGAASCTRIENQVSQKIKFERCVGGGKRSMTQRMRPAQGRRETKRITALHSNAVVARTGGGRGGGGVRSQWARKVSSCWRRQGAKLDSLFPSLPSRSTTTAMVETATAMVSFVRQTRATLTQESPGVGDEVVSGW